MVQIGSKVYHEIHTHEVRVILKDPTDVDCPKHGYQKSGDNTCELCYRERLVEDGRRVLDGM